MQKAVMVKFSFSKLKIETVNYFPQSPTKIVCNNVLNVRSCLASCLTFKPFLMLDP